MSFPYVWGSFTQYVYIDRSQGSCLRSLRYFRAGVGMIVGRARAQCVPGLAPAHWWWSWVWGLWLYGFRGTFWSSCQPAGGWGCILGPPSDRPKVSQRWNWPLVVRARAWRVPRLVPACWCWLGPATAGYRAAVVLGLVSAHWWAGLGPAQGLCM